MKTTVYSWRVSSARKAALEELARKQKRSIAQVLDEAVGHWLERQSANDGDDKAEQDQMRSSAARAIGSIAGGDPNRAEQARQRTRQRLQARRSARK